MAITRLGGATAITGTIPQGNIANASLGAVTALPAAIPTGRVLQVVNAISTTEVVNNSETWTDTGCSAAITPSATSSKIFITANIQGVGKNGTAYVVLKLLRGSTDIVANFEQLAKPYQ